MRKHDVISINRY